MILSFCLKPVTSLPTFMTLAVRGLLTVDSARIKPDLVFTSGSSGLQNSWLLAGLIVFMFPFRSMRPIPSTWPDAHFSTLSG